MDRKSLIIGVVTLFCVLLLLLSVLTWFFGWGFKPLGYFLLTFIVLLFFALLVWKFSDSKTVEEPDKLFINEKDFIKLINEYLLGIGFINSSVNVNTYNFPRREIVNKDFDDKNKIIKEFKSSKQTCLWWCISRERDNYGFSYLCAMDKGDKNNRSYIRVRYSLSEVNDYKLIIELLSGLNLYGKTPEVEQRVKYDDVTRQPIASVTRTGDFEDHKVDNSEVVLNEL